LRWLWKSWVDLWDRREPATAQALVRIGVGLTLAFDLLQVRWLGIVDATWAPPPNGLGYGAASHPAVVRWFGASVHMAELLWAVALIAALLFTIGAATRLSGFVFVWVYAQMAYLAPDSDRGIDMALRIVVLILCVSWSHARWSVDALVMRKIGRPYPAEVPAWPRILLLLQLIWIYFSGGHNKSGPEWGPAGDFSALANALSDPGFARFTSGWVPSIYELTQLATIMTMGFELGAPVMLLVTWLHATRARGGVVRTWVVKLRLRWIWIFTGIAFHLGIAVTLRLGIFPWGMMAIYPVLFHPDELVRAEAWVRKRLPSRTSAAREG
jgi:hypothetical protein